MLFRSAARWISTPAADPNDPQRQKRWSQDDSTPTTGNAATTGAPADTTRAATTGATADTNTTASSSGDRPRNYAGPFEQSSHLWQRKEEPDDEPHTVPGDARISLRAQKLDQIADDIRNDILLRSPTPRAAMQVLAHYGHRLMVSPFDTPPGSAAETSARASAQIERMGKYLFCTEELWEPPTDTDDHQ